MAHKEKRPSVLAEYKRLVEPILREAGFAGRTQKLESKPGRGELVANFGKRRDELYAILSGTDGRSFFSWASTTWTKRDKPDTLAKKMSEHVKAVKKGLALIARMDFASAPPPKTLTDAMHALLEWLSKDSDFRKIGVTKVVARGRTFEILLRGRKSPIRADRTAIAGLLRDLRDGKLAARGRDLRYALHGEELDAYVALLAKKDVDEARALWVHLCSPFDLPAKGHALARLFTRPLYATKSLNVGASAGAVILRALPHTAKGSLVDRVAAIYVVGMLFTHARTHAKADEIRNAVKALTTSLAAERSPLLRDCGVMLESLSAGSSRAT